MTPEQFVYWLQGYSEITDGQSPTPEQWLIIQDHLKAVFDKKTPDRGMPVIPNPLKEEFNRQTVPYIPPVQPYFDQPKTPQEPPYKIVCGAGGAGGISNATF